jgi:hypothetical protein
VRPVVLVIGKIGEITMIDTATLSDASRAALAQLRSPSTFNWTIVYILILTGFLYSSEVQARRWNVIGAGLALWFADWINEILNSALLHWTGQAPLWVETGPTAYQILVGLNAETTFLFLIYGMVYAKMLPGDRDARIFGMNGRLAIALGMSIFSVILELFLNRIGVLNWYWSFWDKPYGLPVIVVFGYLWFFLVAAWAHDAPTELARWRRVGVLAATAMALALTFGPMGWL